MLTAKREPVHRTPVQPEEIHMAENQTIKGDMLVDSLSTLNLYLKRI